MTDLLVENTISYSKPMAGRTMLGLLKKFGPVIHDSHLLLSSELECIHKSNENTDWKSDILLFRFNEDWTQILNNQRHQLIASTLILNWICGRALNQISSDASLIDAEMWFRKCKEENCFSFKISNEVNKSVHGKLKEISKEIAFESFPYLAEVFETGNEVANEKGANRKTKKVNGVYYTPTDVIDFIVSRSISNLRKNTLKGDLQWYDPAVGTGSFILSILKHYSSPGDNYKSSIDFAVKGLFGTDTSPLALQSAVYIISTNCLLNTKQTDLRVTAKTIGHNFLLQDSSAIDSKEKLKRLFPSVGNDGVDLIVSNPPYSKRKQNQLTLFDSSSIKSGDDLYPFFLKHILDLTNDKIGGGGMVVPLSLVTSSLQGIRNIRNYILSKTGKIEFWNFDRTPDSLFGDDVKTRNTIFFFTKDESIKTAKVYSTSLHRWNSRNRTDLFRTIGLTDVTEVIEKGKVIPKIGDEFGVNVFRQISKRKSGSIGEIITPSTFSDGNQLVIKSTAYNWIPVELVTTNKYFDSPNHVVWRIRDTSIISPELVYAILNSRVTYWLWRVNSDGFHITNQFINNLPFGLSFIDRIDKAKMTHLGLSLWTKVRDEIVVSKNAGTVSYSYCPLKFQSLLDEIDHSVVECLEITPTSIDYFKTFINQLIVSGRENESTISSKIKYLEPSNLQ